MQGQMCPHHFTRALERDRESETLLTTLSGAIPPLVTHLAKDGSNIQQTIFKALTWKEEVSSSHLCSNKHLIIDMKWNSSRWKC